MHGGETMKILRALLLLVAALWFAARAEADTLAGARARAVNAALVAAAKYKGTYVGGGIVTAVDQTADTFSFKNKKGRTRSFKVTAATKFENGTFADLKVGTKVKVVGKAGIAEEVYLRKGETGKP
jgi:hypothetical protein